MNLQSYKRIYKQDFQQEDQNLVEKLSYSINSGFDIVYEALNKRLTFDDNFNSNIVTFNVTVNATGVPTLNGVFRTSVSGSITGLVVIKAVNQTNNKIYPTSSPFISFTQNSSNVTINNITGLQAANSYQITVLIIGT